MRLDVGLPTEIVTAGSDSNVSVCIRLGVEAIQRNCYNETNNNNNSFLPQRRASRAMADRMTDQLDARTYRFVCMCMCEHVRDF